MIESAPVKMRPTLAWSRILLALAVGAGAAEARPPGQRGLQPGLDSVPWEWLKQEREEIRWEVRVSPGWLTWRQRHSVAVTVAVPARPLQSRSVERDLHLLVKASDPAGRWYRGQGYRAFKVSETVDKRADIVFTVLLHARPGEYVLSVLLYDRVLGERSGTQRKVRVRPVPSDPLPELGRDLPAIEFQPEGDPSRRSSLPAGQGRLILPLETRRPLRIELLVNFSPSDEVAGSEAAHRRTIGLMQQILDVLAGLQPARGSVRLTGFDLLGRRVIFEQENVREVDWRRLREAVGQLNPGTVDVRTLEARTRTADFFREWMMGKLAEADRRPRGSPAGAPSGSSPGLEPLRVYILVGNAMLFPRGTPVRPLAAEGDCDCRVYYLREETWYRGMWDQLEKIIKPLEPRTFDIREPRDLRKALAAMLKDLRQY